MPDWSQILGRFGQYDRSSENRLVKPTLPFNGYGMSPGAIHHNEFVNGAMGYTPFDEAGTRALLEKLGHGVFNADSAGAYHNEFGTTVYFFNNGKAVKSVDLNALPQMASAE